MKILSNLSKLNASILIFAFLKIPMIWFARPIILVSDRVRMECKIRLNRRTRNHLRSMYFGALVVGAEFVVAARALQKIQVSRRRVDFIFKDFSIQCLKRAEGDVHFICDQAAEIDALVEKTIASGQRETQTFNGYAIVPSKSESERVIEFQVTLSVKAKA